MSVSLLSNKEKELLDLAAAGDDDAQIAVNLGLKKSTIAVYKSGIKRSLKVKEWDEAKSVWLQHKATLVGQRSVSDLVEFTCCDDPNTDLPDFKLEEALKAQSLSLVPYVGQDVYFYAPVDELEEGRKYDGSKHQHRIVQMVAAKVTEVEEPGNPESRLALFIMTRQYSKHHWWVEFGQTKAGHWGWMPPR